MPRGPMWRAPGGDDSRILVENCTRIIRLDLLSGSSARFASRSACTAEVSTSVASHNNERILLYSPDDVMLDADIAMYRARRKQVSYVVRQSIHPRSLASLLGLIASRNRREQLELAYQPMLDRRTRRVWA